MKCLVIYSDFSHFFFGHLWILSRYWHLHVSKSICTTCTWLLEFEIVFYKESLSFAHQSFTHVYVVMKPFISILTYQIGENRDLVIIFVASLLDFNMYIKQYLYNSIFSKIKTICIWLCSLFNDGKLCWQFRTHRMSLFVIM